MTDRVMASYYQAKRHGQNAAYAAAKAARRAGWSDEQIRTLAMELKKH